MKNIFFLLFISALFAACNSSNLKPLDLQQYGANLSIKAPEGAVVTEEALGLRKEITVKDGQYDLIISVASDNAGSVESLLAAEKTLVEQFELFTRFVKEDANGFIFETDEGATKNYDFRYIHKKNQTAYFFRRNFVGDFELAEVEQMYDGIQQK